MKKHYFTLLSIVLFSIISCSKDEIPKVQEDPITTVSKYTLVENEATPGDIVEIKSEQKITEQSINISLNNTKVDAYAVGEYSYKFIVPAITSGNYDVKIPKTAEDLILKLKISPYTTIDKPEEIISSYVLKRDKCFEEINKSGTSIETIILIDQIKQEWDIQYSKSSAEEKKLLAYILQKNSPNPEWFNTTRPFDDSYYNKSNASAFEIGEALIVAAKEFTIAHTFCAASIGFTTLSVTAFYKWPNHYTAAAMAVGIAAFIISREVAIIKAGEVGLLKGFADAISSTSTTQKTASFELVNKEENDISMSVGFRNLNGSDSTVQTDITNAFNGERVLVEKDSEIKRLYDDAIKFTEKLKGLYPSYTPVIGNKPQRKLNLTILDKDLIVKGSSDPTISITTTLIDGVRKIKATSDSKDDLNFYLKVGYKRTIDGKELTKDIPYTFKAIKPIDSTAYYTKLMIGECVLNFGTSKEKQFYVLKDDGSFLQTGGVDGNGNSYTTHECVSKYNTWNVYKGTNGYSIALKKPYESRNYDSLITNKGNIEFTNAFNTCAGGCTPPKPCW